jgi:DNA-binding MarR family transcriptional regulator
MTPGALALTEGVQPQSLTRVPAELEQLNYVLRQQDAEDRRQFRLELTAEGRETLEMRARRRALWLASAMASVLTPTEEQMLLLAAQVMEKLAEFSSDQQTEG